MKTLKIGLVTLLALLVLYTGASWYTGMRAQSMLEHSVEESNQRLARMLGGRGVAGNVTVSDYQRGVFSSQVRYTVSLQGLGLVADSTPQTVQVQMDLQHGPFPSDLVSRGDFSPQMIYAQARLLPTPLTQPWFDVAGADAVQMQARIDFAQNGSADLIVAPVSLKTDRNALRFSGGEIHFTIRNRFADSEASGSFASLDVLEDGRDGVRIRDITFTGQSHQGDDAAQSEAQMNAASVDVDLPDVGAAHIENVGIGFAMEQVGTLMDYSVRYGFGDTTFNGRKVGAFDLGLNAKQIDIPAVMALSQALEDAAQDGGEMDPDVLQTHALALLKAQPTIAIDPLRWRMDKGESRAMLTVDLFAQDDDDLDLDDFGLQYVRQANLSVDVSRAMALQVAGLTAGDNSQVMQGMFAMMFDQYASQLQSAGLVRVDGDKVSLNASYRGEDETVELNGRRMSLGEFMMLVMQTF